MVDYYKQPDDFLKFSLENKDMMHDLDFYSPAEKYDLLVGDPKFTLTNLTKSNGFKWEEEDGTVAQWMGICHGWAIASYASPRPTKIVEVKGLSKGAKLSFLPRRSTRTYFPEVGIAIFVGGTLYRGAMQCQCGQRC